MVRYNQYLCKIKNVIIDNLWQPQTFLCEAAIFKVAITEVLLSGQTTTIKTLATEVTTSPNALSLLMRSAR